MKKRQLSGWLGPPVGTVAGAGFGYGLWYETPDSSLTWCLTIGVLMGLVAGLIVWFSDWLAVRRGMAEWERARNRPAKRTNIGVALPLLAWAVGWIPLIGLAVSIAAYRASGGRSMIAFYSFILSGGSTLTALMILPRFLIR